MEKVTDRRSHVVGASNERRETREVPRDNGRVKSDWILDTCFIGYVFVGILDMLFGDLNLNLD
jgi:hypothetical protein